MEPASIIPDAPPAQIGEILETFRRGDVSAAIQGMREVVARRPDDYRAWSLIAEWEAQERHFQQSLEAAQVMARLAPRSAEPLGFMGNAQLEMAKRREALETFRKAFELEPDDGCSGYRVFDLELASREREAARKTLALLELHMPGSRTIACQVRLRSALREKQEALEGLRKLCLAAASDTTALSEAAKAVTGAGWRREAEDVYLQMLDEPEANPEIGALWVEGFVFRRAWKYRVQLRGLDPAKPVGRGAWSAYLKALGEQKKADLARRAVQRHGAALRGDSVCWGQASYALTSNSLYQETADWMSDWRSHPEAEPWILFNAALAFRQIGKPDEARTIHAEALNRQSDHTTRLHRIWLAADSAAAGDIAGARSHLAIIDGNDLSALHEAAYLLALATVAVDAAPERQKTAAYHENWRTLKKPRYRAAFRTRAFHDLTRRSVKIMAASAQARPYRLGAIELPRHIRLKAGWAVALFFGVVIGMILCLGWYFITQSYIYLPKQQSAAKPSAAPAYTPFRPLFKPSGAP